MEIKINNRIVNAEKGELILDVINRNGIDIPTLCHIKDTFPSGACRMCLVEDMQTGKLITSCSNTVQQGMEIFTHSQRVIESRKVIIELLLSNHPDDCLYCVRNNNCELQSLAKNLDIRERRVSGEKNNHYLDISSPSIVRDPAKCILCGRCVKVCEEVIGVSAIDFLNRGSQTVIGTTFNGKINTSSCINCGQCIMVCPTAALTEKNHFAELQTTLNKRNKKVIVQYAPSITVSIAEEFGLESGIDLAGALNAALRQIGFNLVFDTSFSADLTIMEEATELIDRIVNGGKLPMITSCCPSWVKYAEEFEEDMLTNISSCKSPQQMMGAIIKSYVSEQEKIAPEDIYSVSIMPCTAKKFEAQREEMINDGICDVDAVLTTRELIQLIKVYGIDLNNIIPENCDSPLGARSSAGKIFGTSGGVMEAAIRTAYNKLTGRELIKFQIPQVRGNVDFKETTIKIGDLDISVAVVNGLGNAKKVLEDIRAGKKQYHFIEIMACPGGCINGGGQPIGSDLDAVKARALSLYNIDMHETIKVSHKNPDIIELYNSYLEKPNSHKSHRLLHTTYMKRDVLK